MPATISHLAVIEGCVLVMACVVGFVFYLLYGPIPALRMFFGVFLFTNFTLVWVFRAGLMAALRRLLS